MNLLLAEHIGIQYNKPSFRKDYSSKSIIDSVIDIFIKSPEDNNTIKRDYVTGNLSEMSLERFMSSFGELRDELAYRKLKGEILTEREEVVLNTLNQEIERLLEPSLPKAAEYKPILDEAKRFLQSIENGNH